MIKLFINPNYPETDPAYVVSSDEPVTVNIGPDNLAYIYDCMAEDLTDDREPIFCYDPNNFWPGKLELTGHSANRPLVFEDGVVSFMDDEENKRFWKQ